MKKRKEKDNGHGLCIGHVVGAVCGTDGLMKWREGIVPVYVCMHALAMRSDIYWKTQLLLQ